jgi:hypothetical protein
MMENSTSFAPLLSLTFGLLCLWVAYFYLYRTYCLDAFRQKMFTLRDQLFDEAAAGLIAFDHPVYGLLRKTMNGYLRFGHKLTLTETFILFLHVRKDQKELEPYTFDARFKKVSQGLDEEALARVNFYHEQMHTLLIKHMLKGSPVFLFIMMVLICMIVPIFFFVALKQKIYAKGMEIMAEPIGNLESMALAYGGLK